MAKSGVTWVRPPSQLQMDNYWRKVEAAVVAVAEFLGQKMQDYARKNARWTDRTGNARSGLFYQVVNEAAKEMVTIYLAHTMDYGVYLELNFAGRYAILWPTIEKHLPELMNLLEGIFN